MSKIKLTLSLFVVFIISFSNKGLAQYYEIDPIYYYNFDKDSLKGFDENAARASAISERFLGPELKIQMYRLKREYINNKYNLERPKPYYNTISDYLAATRPAAVPGCVNEDFEASAAAAITASNQVTGWVVTAGYNGFVSPTSTGSLITYFPGGLNGATSCNLTGCCPMPPANSAIIDCSAPGGYIDNVIGAQYHIYSVFGTGTVSGSSAANPQISTGLFGTKILRLNDELTGDYSLEKLSKTFAVTSSNSLFQFAFISVFSPGHGCCDAGGFQIRLTNATTNSVIACPNFSVSAPSSACTSTSPVTYLNAGSGTTYSPNVNFGNIYHPWKINSLDLTAYIGQNITIDIIVSDCTAGGHFGCVYFDAQCGPMTVYGNGNPYDAGTNVTVPTCGASGATICASDGLGPYAWAGPGLTPNQTTLSYTNQCLITSISAQYTLYMQPEGSCVPIQRIVNSTITPAPLVAITPTQATCGTSVAVITATPSGSAGSPSSLIWSPTPFSLNSATTTATYQLPTLGNTLVVSVTASDPLGCKVTATANVYPAPPIPTFSIQNATNSSSITCDYPTINLNAVTNYSYNGGSLKYFWASASTTFSSVNTVNITNPGTYTIQGLDSLTNCGSTQLITIGVNTVAPTSVLTPTFQNITCNVTSITDIVASSNPSVNITHSFTSPQGAVFTSASNSVAYTPGGVGTFTYCLKNDINGCTSCKQITVTSSQGFPTYNVVSPQNFTLGCGSKSTATVNIINGSTQLPAGGPVSYSVLSASSGSATSAGALSNVNTYSFNAPGTYTVVVKDNTSFCETRTPISILSNTFAPNVSALVERQILDCNVPKLRLQGQSLTPGVDYLWQFPGATGSLVGDTITIFANFLTPTSTIIATYSLTTTNTLSTCKSTSLIPMYQNLFTPNAVVSNGGINNVSCKTQTINLTNQSTSNIPGGSIFPTGSPVIGSLWEGPTPQEPKLNSTSYLAQTAGVYTMTAMDLGNGCKKTTTLSIADNRIYPNLSLPAITPSIDCGVNTTATVAPVISGTTTGLTYEWTTPPTATVNGVNSLALITNEQGDYSVLVTNTVNGCASRINIDVVNGKLTADFDADQVSGFAPLTVNFTNKSRSSSPTTGTANINSVWNYGNGTSSVTTSNNLNPATTYSLPGTYTITLFATKGSCSETKQRIVRVDIPSAMVIPNVFTPNGDGINDLFFVKANNLSEISAIIFDRWGHKIYDLTATDGKNIGWDGKNQYGKEVAEGTYFFIIKATGKDGRTYNEKGTVNLYR